MIDLLNKKVFAKNKSKELQEKLFTFGFKNDGIKPDKLFIFLNDNFTILCTNDVNYFYEYPCEEIPVEDILNIELKSLPKTWEEYCKSNPIKDYKSDPAYLALMQLHQLRDCYRQGPYSKFSYTIIRNDDDFCIINVDEKFLSFQTKEVAQEFLNNFRDLIKQAGDLI